MVGVPQVLVKYVDSGGKYVTMVAGPVPNVVNGELVAVPPVMLLFGAIVSTGDTQVVTRVNTDELVAVAVTWMYLLV